MDGGQRWCLYFANTILIVIAVQLLFGLVANAVWPIYYAVASDSAQPSATSTANGIITTAMFIGGGIAPVLMGTLISMGGGWTSLSGYTVCFFVMAGCARWAGRFYNCFLIGRKCWRCSAECEAGMSAGLCTKSGCVR